MFSKYLWHSTYEYVLYVIFAFKLTSINGNGKGIQKPENMPEHILQEPKFWETFAYEILDKKSWKCSFPDDILEHNIESDSQLYKDDIIMKYRRTIAKTWQKNDTAWSTTILGACKELAYGINGSYVKELQKSKVIQALKDYVDHLHYFYKVANIMKTRGHEVEIYGQNGSPIHDIDKLDPIMLVGYSERFEDNKVTSLWDLCVNRHTHSNTHHQAHCLWHNCCHLPHKSNCSKHANMALQEMVCDKVSRRLQKDFMGKESEDIWDVNVAFYEGLPTLWLNKAISMTHDLKH